MNSINLNEQTLIAFLSTRQDHHFGSEVFKEFFNETQDFLMLGMSFAEFRAAKDSLLESGLLVLMEDNNKTFASITFAQSMAA